MPTPTDISSDFADLYLCAIPEMADFGWEETETDLPPYFQVTGGESSALDLLENLCADGKVYYEATDRIFTGSSHMGAYLALGCLSPKMLFWRLKQSADAESRFKKLFHELIVRDFLRLQVKKHGERAFLKGGMRGRGDDHLIDDRKSFNAWIGASTGEAYVDAFMNELRLTGYLPQIGRLSVACYLVNQLGVNWQMGAEYFESMLVDYDPCSNWGNWNIVSGVGGEFKDFSQYNIEYQCKKLDPRGLYLDRWLPSLSV